MIIIIIFIIVTELSSFKDGSERQTAATSRFRRWPGEKDCIHFIFIFVFLFVLYLSDHLSALNIWDGM